MFVPCGITVTISGPKMQGGEKNIRVIVVDDEQMALNDMERKLKAFREFTQITIFRSPTDALKWLGENRADIAFLDIHMQQMNGLILAKHVKDLCPCCAIVFVTGYSQYAMDAIKLRASGYLLKPVEVEDIRGELDYILSLSQRPNTCSKRVRVRCFGHFEIFADEKPMRFQYSKTKELLAYLIDRKGALCTNGELMGILWDDMDNLAKHRSYFGNLCADLIEAFHEVGCAEVIYKRRGMLAVVPDKIDCDYFRWSEGDIRAINAYNGEYMTQYSWSEFTLGSIEKKLL